MVSYFMTDIEKLLPDIKQAGYLLHKINDTIKHRIPEPNTLSILDDEIENMKFLNGYLSCMNDFKIKLNPFPEEI